jgi:predicted transcriptional regulator
MAELKESSLSDPARALEEEDEATLAAIDRGSKAAAEGRTAPMEEARQRLKEWLTRFSTPKKP